MISSSIRLTDHSESSIKAALANASLSNDGDLKRFIWRCIEGGADLVARAPIIHLIAEVTKVHKPELKKIWKKVEKEKLKEDRNPRAQASKAGERLPIYTPGSFRDNCNGL